MAFSGCAIGWSAVPEVQATTRLSVAIEGRGEVMAAGGSSETRAFVSLAGGGGARIGGAGYGLISPGVGFELFREHRLSFATNYTGRFGPEGPVHSISGSVSWVFRFDDTGGERGFLAIGPRLRVEALALPDGSWAGGVSLGVELRWVSFDTTGNRW